MNTAPEFVPCYIDFAFGRIGARDMGRTLEKLAAPARLGAELAGIPGASISDKLAYCRTQLRGCHETQRRYWQTRIDALR